jgi:hypothetical protein
MGWRVLGAMDGHSRPVASLPFDHHAHGGAGPPGCASPGPRRAPPTHALRRRIGTSSRCRRSPTHPVDRTARPLRPDPAIAGAAASPNLECLLDVQHVDHHALQSLQRDGYGAIRKDGLAERVSVAVPARRGGDIAWKRLGEPMTITLWADVGTLVGGERRSWGTISLTPRAASRPTPGGPGRLAGPGEFTP